MVLRPDQDLDYWKFSWAENGLYDLPAMLTFIKSTTGSAKVAYVGHSMGSTAMYYLMAKDYNTFKEHVSIFVAVAPATKITTTSSPVVRWFASRTNAMQDHAERFLMYELVPSSKLMYYIVYVSCGLFPELCYLGMVLVSDKQRKLFDHDRFLVWLAHNPSGCSLWSLVHYG